MINPRSINVTCNYSDVIDQDVCLNNSIKKIIDIKAENLAELPIIKAEIELQNLNISICVFNKTSVCATGPEYARYAALKLAAQNKLDTVNGYLSDGDIILNDLNTKVSDLHESVAYKNAIRLGAIPPKPANQTVTLPDTSLTKNNLVRNIAIGVGIIVVIAVIIFIVKRVTINKN